MCTEEAILTILKPVWKETIRTVITEETKCAFIGIYTILTFVAVLTTLYLIRIKTIFTVNDPFWIVDMFWVGSIDTEITIFDMICVICKFGIFAIFCKEIDARHLELKFSELPKKWCIKIKLHAVIHRRPIISPPYFLVVDCIRFIWRVNWDNLISRLVTFPVVEFPFISKCETSSLSLIRTECRTRYEILLSRKYWRNFFVKFEIFISYEKFLSAQTADFLFDDFLVGRNESHNEF